MLQAFSTLPKYSHRKGEAIDEAWRRIPPAQYRAAPLARLAQELRLDPDLLIERARDLSQRVADQVPDIRRGMINSGLTHPIIPRLADTLIDRATTCRNLLHAT
jgi:hypothetical protein